MDEKEEELVSSKKSDTSSSMSSAPGCTPPPPPPLLLPPPPPPLPPPLITSSTSPVITISNNFLSRNQQQAGNNVSLSSNQTVNNTCGSEIDRQKLKPLRWIKISTSEQISVWNRTSLLQKDTTNHRSTMSKQANNFINLAKLNVLFVQQQKQTVKCPEVKISLNDEVFSQKCINTHIDEANNNNSSSYCHMARDNDTVVQDKKLTVFQINNPKRLDVTSSSYPTRGRSLSSSRTMEFVQKHYEANLLESQRCLNVNIFLRQFRNSHISLLDLINQCDGSLIGSERLRDLIKLLPTDEEIKSFKSFQGNVDYMDPAERFFYDLVRIPKYYLKIDSMLLKEEFQTAVNWIKLALDNVLKTGQEILTSPLICELLQTVLEIGNYMNRGDNLGSASGFKISSLLKLSEVRSNDPKITLLHFLVQELKVNNSPILRIKETLPCLKEASEVSLELVMKEIHRFRSRLKNMSEYFNQDAFEEHSQIHDFIETSNKELNEVQIQLEKVQEIEKSCAHYFCECPTQFRITECLQTFNQFFEKMKSTEQEISEYESLHKERTDKVNKVDASLTGNSKSDERHNRTLDNNIKQPNQDAHNMMIELISNNLSHPRIVHSQSRSRFRSNKLSLSTSTNSLSKLLSEDNNTTLNQGRSYTSQLNIASKSVNIPNGSSLFEQYPVTNSSTVIRSRQSGIGQKLRINSKFLTMNDDDIEVERERRPWSQIRNQSMKTVRSGKETLNPPARDTQEENYTSDEESFYQLDERIKRLTSKFNKKY
ncbi:unnamed protein product [Trichobilharzia szidati]|nr:unnamed protein product [Trichobilharzia szidati]